MVIDVRFFYGLVQYDGGDQYYDDFVFGIVGQFVVKVEEFGVVGVDFVGIFGGLVEVGEY